MKDSVSRVNSANLHIAISAWSPQPHSFCWPQSSNKNFAQRQRSKIFHHRRHRLVPLLPWWLVHINSYRAVLYRVTEPFPRMVHPHYGSAGESHDTFHNQTQTSLVQPWNKQEQLPTIQLAPGLTGGTAAARTGLLVGWLDRKPVEAGWKSQPMQWQEAWEQLRSDGLWVCFMSLVALHNIG